MKKTLLLIALIVSVLTVVAQPPAKMNYQAVARDASGVILANQNICVQFRITDGNGGPLMYSETESVTTNQFGLFTVEIGDSDFTAFVSIPWSASVPWLNVQMDVGCTSAFTDMGSSQLLSVPYAMFSADNHWSKTGSSISNTNNGYVGIGTSTPGAQLDVVQNDAANNAANFSIGNNGSPHTVVQATTLGSGNALAGASTGMGYAVFGYQSGFGGSAFFQVDNSANALPALQAVSNGSGAAAYFNNTGTGPALRTGSGNVGIGTSTPVQRLHVYSSSGDAGLLVEGGNTGAARLGLFSGGPFETELGFNNSLLFGSIADNSMVMSNEWMRISSNGNVGIGTAGPLQKLDVNGGVRIGTTPDNAQAGTMRYEQGAFQGYDGSTWHSLSHKYQTLSSFGMQSTIRNTYVYSPDSLVLNESGTYLLTFNVMGSEDMDLDWSTSNVDDFGTTLVYKVGSGAVSQGLPLFARVLDQGTPITYYRYVRQPSSTTTFLYLNAGDVLKVAGYVSSGGNPPSTWRIDYYNIELLKLSN